MAKNNKKVFIVYFSPAGSTGHVAKVMETTFNDLGTEVSVFDLAKKKDLSKTISAQIQKLKENSCLIIGSPVYVSHAVPPVMKFIAELIDTSNAHALPFVTWGGASSGISLFEMGRDLLNKGFSLLGAAKFLAIHSLMWQLDDPLGKGHPSPKDDETIRELAIKINKKLHDKNPKEIELSAIAYQNETVHKEMEKISIEVAKAHMPQREVDKALCNQCRVCAEVCPVDAVAFSPYPEFGDNCIFCFNCMKNCEENAIIADLSAIWQRIRERSEFFAERPFTQLFV